MEVAPLRVRPSAARSAGESRPDKANSPEINPITMKPILLTLTLLLLSLLPANAAKKPAAHPINVAILIVEKTDSAKIASTFDYYGYALQGTEDGYSIMKDTDGNEIRYSFNPQESKHPTLIVKTNETHKAIDTRLKDLSFDKTPNGYERVRNMYSTHATQCNFGPHSTLIIRRPQR